MVSSLLSAMEMRMSQSGAAGPVDQLPDECPDLVGVLVNQLPGAADIAGAAGLAELSVVLDVELVPPVLVGDSLPP